jgi:hypothetical protein
LKNISLINSNSQDKTDDLASKIVIPPQDLNLKKDYMPANSTPTTASKVSNDDQLKKGNEAGLYLPFLKGGGYIKSRQVLKGFYYYN